MNVEPDEAQLRVWRSFLETHSTLIRALEKEMQADQGLPLTWYDVLVHLSEASGGRLRHQALAKSLLLSRSGITRLVDRMATAGLVRREPCPDDRAGFLRRVDRGRPTCIRTCRAWTHARDHGAFRRPPECRGCLDPRFGLRQSAASEKRHTD